MILGVPVGNYYHIANNLHFYEDKISLVENNAKAKKSDFQPFNWQGYDQKFELEEFDSNLKDLEKYRNSVKRNTEYKPPFSNNDFFQDWAKVFYRYHSKDISVNFKNPYINRLFGRPKFKPNSEYVKVLINGTWTFYEVYKPQAYLAECVRDGKIAEYVGRVDKYGYLND